MSGSHAPRNAHGPVRIAGPDTAGQPVDGVVGDADRVVFGVVRQNGKHWSENFFLRDGHLGLHIREDGRLDIIALVETCGTPAAHYNSRAFLLTFGDVSLHALALRG